MSSHTNRKRRQQERAAALPVEGVAKVDEYSTSSRPRPCESEACEDPEILSGSPYVRVLYEIDVELGTRPPETFHPQCFGWEFEQ